MKNLITLTAAAFLLSSCFITNAAGIKPSDGVPGKEVKERVQNDIRLMYSRLLNTRYASVPTDAMSGVFTATINVSKTMDIQDHKFYTVISFRKCIDDINTMGPFLALEQLKAKETTSGITTTDVKSIGTLTGYMLIGMCSIEPTGELIQLGATSL